MNELEDPEFTRDTKDTLGKVSEDNNNIRESGFERADMPSVTVFSDAAGSTWLESCGFDSAFFLKNRESKLIHRLSARLSPTCDFSCRSGPRIIILPDFTTASRSCPTLETVAGKERWWAARRDGGGKEKWWQARRDGSRQREMAAGKVRWWQAR